jgi:A1 cistron-splicing factor AAR2
MIKKASIQLQKITVTRFHVELLPSSKPDLTDCDIDMTTDAYATECGDNTQQDSDEDDEEMDDEDGPVIVPNDEVEASISRSSLDAQYSQKYGVQINKDIEQHRKEYPLLFAAVTPHEDVVMACARILDAGNDVSLVREAAAYLEDVEAYRR